MSEIAHAIARASRTDARNTYAELLKTVFIFCGFGLLVTLMIISYGIDLSPGFF
jgi:ribose/xylose/arabinose/galactoside ABC-type transport system permease subunit